MVGFGVGPMATTTIKTKLVHGPFGPHHGKWVFWHLGAWHFYRWASKEECKDDLRNLLRITTG